MRLFTIGFTQTSAEGFFTRLAAAQVRGVLDVRLNNTSQLAGFAKSDDLRFFLSRLGNFEYRHEPLLAPTAEMLGEYRKTKGGWAAYEGRFLSLMQDRKIEQHLTPASLDGFCLLCSEAKPHQCHRRLVAEYLRGRWGNVEILHL